MPTLERIRRIRRLRGYSQEYMAEQLQTTQQHYACYENGKHEIPLRQFKKICQVLEVSADEILGLQ